MLIPPAFRQESGGSGSGASIGTVRVSSSRGASGTSTSQDPVLVARAGLLGHHVGAQLHHPPERAVLDLDLLVEPAGGLVRPPLAGDHELAPADLEPDLVDVHPGELRLHDGARRVVDVEDVHARLEAPPRRQAGALEDVAEQLVDLAPHALEVREQVALWAHGREG